MISEIKTSFILVIVQNNNLLLHLQDGSVKYYEIRQSDMTSGNPQDSNNRLMIILLEPDIIIPVGDQDRQSCHRR